MVITDQLGFNRKNLYLRGGLAKESIIEGRAINLASLDKNLLLRGHLSGKNLSLRGRAAQKASKPSKIFIATLICIFYSCYYANVISFLA